VDIEGKMLLNCFKVDFCTIYCDFQNAKTAV